MNYFYMYCSNSIVFCFNCYSKSNVHVIIVYFFSSPHVQHMVYSWLYLTFFIHALLSAKPLPTKKKSYLDMTGSLFVHKQIVLESSTEINTHKL